MDSLPKRRARFKKGVTPPPLEPPVKLTWFEEYEQRQRERKRRQEKRLRTRKPLPEPDEIREQFVNSTLRYFARPTSNFWESTQRRFLCYRSDFLGMLRLGQHIDSYDRIVAACRKAEFPDFRHGKIEVKYPEISENNRKDTPKISHLLAATSEWKDATSELRDHLGIEGHDSPPSKNAQRLIDFAKMVPMGTAKTMPKDQHSDWSVWECERAVNEGQVVDPRLFYEGDSYDSSTITVCKQRVLDSQDLQA